MQLAQLVKGQFHDKYKEWYWCVKRKGKFISIADYLDVKNDWREFISQSLDKINRLEGD